MVSMLNKELLSTIAIALTLAATLPYIRSIINNSVKPHVFSWVVWGSTTFIVFLAQLRGGAGVGSWSIGVSGILTVSIAVLAYAKRGDIAINKIDWMFFVSAMSSLPLWYLTSNPMWAVVILTTVDVLGFGPTVRKAYAFPYSESLLFFGLFAARNFIVLMALENYSVTTILFPAVMGVVCVLFMTMITYRRRIV